MDAIGVAILSFANFLLGVAGVLFNLVMYYGVFQFANTIGNAPGVLVAWGILRDLANMALLFGFIFMGIATILDTGAVQSFTAKNALPKLLIFAVLMNFSLFTCEAMIDVSNALTSTMYTQANTQPCLSTSTDCVVVYGLAGHIMQTTGLAGIWAYRGKSLDLHVVQYLGLALFATVGALVFFAASIMLAIRVIFLTFLMVLSPIGFAGMAIPPLRKLAGDWWQRVIHQAFYAPIMLLLILISLRIADTFNGAGADGTGAGINNGLGTQIQSTLGNVAVDPNASAISVVLVFMLVIGFLVFAIIAANRFGAAGAGFAVKTAGRLTFGAFGAAGRNTAGRGFYNINERIRRSAFGQTRAGRQVALLAEKGSKASYDFRGTKAAGALGKQTGDLGKPPKDGYSGVIKRQTDEYTAYAKTLKQTDEAKAREKELKDKKNLITESRKKENENWKREKDQRNKEIEQLNEDIAQKEKEREAQNERVTAAIKSNDQDAYRKESSAMDEIMTSHKEMKEKMEKAKADLEAAEQQHNDFIKSFDNELAKTNEEIKGDIDKGIAGVDADSSKRAFAIDLRNSRLPGKGKARSKAVEAIKGELKKSKTEKALDSLKASIDSGKDDTGHKLEEVKEAMENEEKNHDDHGTGGGGDHH